MALQLVEVHTPTICLQVKKLFGFISHFSGAFSPENSFAHGEGLEGTQFLNIESVFYVQVFDECGNPLVGPGPVFDIQINGQDNSNSIPATVEYFEENQHQVSYTPESPGEYRITVTSGSVLISPTPSMITVEGNCTFYRH